MNMPSKYDTSEVLCSFQGTACNKVLEEQNDLKVFLAYPSRDKIRGYMEDLCSQKQLNGLTMFPWEKLSDAAGIIFCKICGHILSSRAIVADITYLNQNVLFELGFGIASKKIPILIREKGRNEKIPSILQDIKRIEYSDINALAGQLYHAVFDDFPFTELYDAPTPDMPFLFFINADANMPVKRPIYEHLEKISKDISLRILIDDSSEIMGHKLIFLLRSIEQSSAVVCHMVGTDFRNFDDINAQVAFLAGYALGRNKKILILQESPADKMIDLQQVRREYKTRAEAIHLLNMWIQPLIDERKAQMEHSKKAVAFVTLQEKLSQALGHPAAEYDTNLENYFIDTPEYLEAKNLRRYLFLGRRGSGKTANFIQLYNNFVSQSRTVVTRIIPSKLQIIGSIDRLHEAIGLEKTTALFEMFWKYIILTEIAISCTNYASKKTYLAEPGLFKTVGSLLEETKTDTGSEFDLRFNTMIDSFTQSVLESKPSNIRAHILSNFYKEHYPKLKKSVQSIGEQHPIVVIIDNLDKDWSALELISISSLINALFGVMAEINILNEFGNCRVVTFLRTDIYKISSKYDPDLDKRQPSFLTWTPETLKQLICERIVQVDEFRGKPDNEVWCTVFGDRFEHIGNTFEYIIKRTMLRPRDLLSLCTTVLEYMNQRNLTSVTEDVIIKAEKSYSEYLLKNLRQEYTVGYPDLEDLCLQLFLGKSNIVSVTQLKARLADCLSTQQGHGINETIRFCFDVGVLGVILDSTDYYAFQGHTFEKLITLAQSKGEPVFVVHPGLNSVLDLQL
jgi:hypothetical protein